MKGVRMLLVLSLFLGGCPYQEDKPSKPDLAGAEVDGKQPQCPSVAPGAGCVPMAVGALWRGEFDPSDSVGGHHGAWNNVGVAAYAPSVRGQGFSFAGKSYVSVPANGMDFHPAGSFTVEGWIQTLQPTGTIASQYECGGYCIGDVSASLWGVYLSAGRLYFNVRDTKGKFMQHVASTAIVADGCFHHFAAIRDVEAKLMSVYVDGKVSGSDTLNPDAAGPLVDEDGQPDPVTIGAGRRPDPDPPTEFFVGIIDELSYSARALGAGEVREIFESGRRGLCP